MALVSRLLNPISLLFSYLHQNANFMVILFNFELYLPLTDSLLETCGINENNIIRQGTLAPITQAIVNHYQALLWAR